MSYKNVENFRFAIVEKFIKNGWILAISHLSSKTWFHVKIDHISKTVLSESSFWLLVTTFCRVCWKRLPPCKAFTISCAKYFQTKELHKEVERIKVSTFWSIFVFNPKYVISLWVLCFVKYCLWLTSQKLFWQRLGKLFWSCQ